MTANEKLVDANAWENPFIQSKNRKKKKIANEYLI